MPLQWLTRAPGRAQGRDASVRTSGPRPTPQSESRAPGPGQTVRCFTEASSFRAVASPGWPSLIPIQRRVSLVTSHEP